MKSEKILLIDIKGLGRVWYLICKDDLIFENVAPFVSKYESTVQVISAYSSCPVNSFIFVRNPARLNSFVGHLEK